jgi:hypothetical protein
MDDLRIQDAVARVAGIDLKSTVRVLRALSIVTDAMGEGQLSDALERLYALSTNNGGKTMDLQAKPSAAAARATDEVNKIVMKKVGYQHLERLRQLDGCPYAASKLIDEVMNPQG